VGPTAGLDDVEKKKFLTLPRLELRPLARPACSQSLYRLSYPGPRSELILKEIEVGCLGHVTRLDQTGVPKKR
jgi:hypothetical protein